MRISDGSSDVCSSDLLLEGPIPLACPVRLIHGLEDADVPWQTSLRLASALESADVEVTLVKGAAHRLSEPEDPARLEHTVEGLAQRAAPRSEERRLGTECVRTCSSGR